MLASGARAQLTAPTCKPIDGIPAGRSTDWTLLAFPLQLPDTLDAVSSRGQIITPYVTVILLAVGLVEKHGRREESARHT